MELYLVRHGITGPSGADADPPLSPEGEARVRGSGRALKKIMEGVELVLVSPMKRADQTARILAGELGCADRVETCQDLSPGQPGKPLVEMLPSLRIARIMLVGHAPDMNRLAGLLLGGGSTYVEMKKGSVCRIDLDGTPPKPPGVLKWLMTQDMLGIIAPT